MYSNFLEEIDAIDNGIEVADGVLRYRITSTLSHRVGWLNPAWNETGVSEDVRFCEGTGCSVPCACILRSWYPVIMCNSCCVCVCVCVGTLPQSNGDSRW